MCAWQVETIASVGGVSESFTVDENGAPHVCWFIGGSIYYATRANDGTWSTETVGSAPNIDAFNYPIIALDSSTIYISWGKRIEGVPPTRDLSVHCYTRARSGGSWSDSIVYSCDSYYVIYGVCVSAHPALSGAKILFTDNSIDHSYVKLVDASGGTPTILRETTHGYAFVLYGRRNLLRDADGNYHAFWYDDHQDDETYGDGVGIFYSDGSSIEVVIDRLYETEEWYYLQDGDAALDADGNPSILVSDGESNNYWAKRVDSWALSPSAPTDVYNFNGSLAVTSSGQGIISYASSGAICSRNYGTSWTPQTVTPHDAYNCIVALKDNKPTIVFYDDTDDALKFATESAAFSFWSGF